MFKKLKDKIAEEVKSSPNRIQQIAQAAQAAVSSASSTTSEISGSDNFFSITEEDTPHNSPLLKPTNLNQDSNKTSLNGILPSMAMHPPQRRTSNSSMRSEVSFRLPSFDDPAVYQLQSDMDTSAGEESTVTSVASIHLESISKEQLYQAYRKVLERSQKYRGRFTELVQRYRDLERDNNKARAVLVETQEKALRRLSELREQSSLEQQAKAHLEASLRLEMDELVMINETLKTKLKLLSENPEKSDTKAIETVDMSTLTEIKLSLADTESVPLSEIKNNEEFKQKLKEISELNNQINILQKQLNDSREEVIELKAREEENTILLAENKMMIHSELENKETEMKKLQNRLSIFEVDLRNSVLEKQKLQEDISNMKLRIEQKSTEISSSADLKEKLQNMELELNMSNGAIEMLNNEKSHISDQLISEKLQNSILENRLKSELDSKSDLNLKLENLTTDNEAISNELKQLKLKFDELNTLNISLNDEIKNLNLSDSKNEVQLKHEIQLIQSEKNKLKDENLNLTSKLEAMNLEIIKLNESSKTLSINIDRINNENVDLLKKSDAISLDCGNFKTKIDNLKTEKRDLEKTLEKEIRDKNELKTQVTNILQEIGRLEDIIRENNNSYKKLQEEKLSIQNKFNKSLQSDEEKLKDMDLKLNESHCENQTLVEKLKLLETENNNLIGNLTQTQSALKNEKLHLTKKLRELEQALSNFNAVSIEHEKTKALIKNLEEKLAQCVDDNSQMLNSKELVEHELRSLQDELEIKEKEKLCLLDNCKTFEQEILQLKIENSEKEDKNQSLIEKLSNIELENSNLTKHLNSLSNKNQSRLNELESLLQRTNDEKKSIHKNATDLEKKIENYEELKIENQYLNTLVKQMEDEQHRLKDTKLDIENKNKIITKDFEQLKQEISSKDIVILELNKNIEKLEKQLNELEENENHKKELDILKEKQDLEIKLQKILNEVQDVSNRNIFLEQKCENYLILEQSNERLKLANDKLSRQLDETLVSIQHHDSELSANTEFEYLKNIMFQYLTGNINKNNSTLVKVIAAVLKFNPQQTQIILDKEMQRNSLV